MRESYQIAYRSESEKLVNFLTKEGQHLLPFVNLVETARLAVDELIDVVGRATVEAVLTLSAEGVAGPKHQGKRGGEVRWHGSQCGKVRLSERKLKVKKPRLRCRRGGSGSEVEIPAYEAMVTNERLGERMLEILLAGVSTRRYRDVIPQMAETVGVSKSSVSREFVEASAGEIEKLFERRFDEVEILIIYIDGLRFGEQHVIAAIGVDRGGGKHVLGLVQGSTENATVVKGLLQDLVERGVKPDRRRLFVIDGSKALRCAIDEVYGAENPVQRCRSHKIRNVTEHLPLELKDQVKAVMNAAYRLDWREGISRLKKQAEWLEVEYPSAAASLREGLEETFTVNRLGLSASLRRCLSSTNIIENPYSGVRRMTRRVSRWHDGRMVLRWAASALLAVEKRFKRIMGWRDLWMLEAVLKEELVDVCVAAG
jgi:transposase-like protein